MPPPQPRGEDSLLFYHKPNPVGRIAADGLGADVQASGESEASVGGGERHGGVCTIADIVSYPTHDPDNDSEAGVDVAAARDSAATDDAADADSSKEEADREAALAFARMRFKWWSGAAGSGNTPGGP